MILIFDWDGTLCDSTGRIVESMQLAASDLAIEVPTVEAVRDVIGLGLAEAMAKLFPRQPLAVREQMRKQYSDRYVQLDAVPAGLFPGVSETLDSLRQDGHQLAIATGKGRRGLDRVLAGLAMADFFDATRCADETASKPDPLMLHELLEELGGKASEALVIGDSVYDLEMARNAAIGSLGVSYGVHSPAQLREHSPLAIMDSLSEMLRMDL